MTITPSQMNILRRLTEKGETIYGGSRSGSEMSQLLEAGLVQATSVNISEVLYELTEAGKKAVQ